jgi:hypothetical protein
MALTKINSSVIANNTIAVGNIADNSVDATKIASNSILTRHIDDNQIGIDQLNVSDGSNGQMLTTNGSGTLSFSTPSSFDADAAQVFNESGAAVDFRIEGDTEQNLFFVDGSADKIGIGTTSPASIFHVDSSFSGTLVTLHQTAGASSSDAGLDVETSSTGTTVQRWLNSGSELMRVVGDGKVGIGTNSPTHHLHVNAGTTNVVAVFESSDAEATVRIKDSTGTAAIKCRNDFRFNKSEATEMMRLNNDGKLIIGDNASHVDDLLQIETPASGGGHGIQIRRNDSNTDQGIGRIMFGNNTDTDLVTIQATTDGATDSARITINTQVAGGASTERMRIDSDGMWRGQLLNNSNTNPLGSGTNSGKLWSTSGNWINVWQVTNDAEGAHYWIEIDIQGLDGYTSYGEIYKDRNGRWRIVQHRQAGTNFQVSSDNNYIQVNQSSGANQTNSAGNLKLVRIPGATA